MNKILIILYLVLGVLTGSNVFGQNSVLTGPFGPHQWTATVKVVGEDGDPIIGANVSFAYSIPATSGSGPTFGEIKETTDADGLCSASHTDSSWDLGVTAGESGYYNTHCGYQFNYDEKRRNPSFTLILKKIGKPIAMYAKQVNLGIPDFDKTIGYDFEVGDWVAPYGKGISTDIDFTGHFDKKAGGESDYTLTVSFPNNGDGIQEFNAPALLQNATMGLSDLRSSHEAPVDGYQSQWVQTDNRKPGAPTETTRSYDRNYYFRVHTKLDSNGNIVSAHYGKIYGDFMQFRYYLNPTINDRNVEFDPKENLLGGLESYEQVKAP